MACLYIVALDAWEGSWFNRGIQGRYNLSLAIFGSRSAALDVCLRTFQHFSTNSDLAGTTMLRRGLPLRMPLRRADWHPQRHISLFRRRPLYKPTTAFGRIYLRVRNLALGLVTISIATFSIVYVLDARSAIHRYVFMPALRLITPDPEDAHRIAVLALKCGLHPKDSKPDGPQLAVNVLPFQ